MSQFNWKKWGRNLTLSVAISSCLIGGVVTPSYATSLPEDEAGIEVHAEQTEWYYRTYNGNKQRRLWSITYGKWLTDWEYC